MDAPKRIMAWSDAAPGLAGTWGVTRYPDAQEYILATEHDRLMAEKDARIAELEAARIMDDYAEMTYSPHHDRMQNAAKTYCAGEIAAAIRAMKGGGDD